MRLTIALFALLAVQGWTSARVIGNGLDKAELFPVLEIPDEVLDEPADEVPSGNPLNCLKHISDAYDTAKEARTVILDIVDYAKNVSTEFKKCINLDGFEENVVCLYNAGKEQYPKGKELYDKAKEIRDKVKEIMDAFDECMD